MRLQIRLAIFDCFAGRGYGGANGDGSRQIADGLEFGEWVAQCGLDG